MPVGTTELDSLRRKFAGRVDCLAGLVGKLSRSRSKTHRRELGEVIEDGLMAFVDDVKFLARHGRVATLSDQEERDWRPPGTAV